MVRGLHPQDLTGTKLNAPKQHENSQQAMMVPLRKPWRDDFSSLRVTRGTTMTMQTSPHTLQTVRQFLDGREWPTESVLRHLIFFNKYGFEKACVRRIGRKIFIDLSAFNSWMLNQAK